MAVGRFADPAAIQLLHEEEREPVGRVRTGAVPRGWRERLQYEMLQGTAAVLVTRTVAIDEAVREVGNPQLVILGAGLDGRAWRLSELASTAVFEVDHPASQADKRDRVGDLTPVAKSVTFVPVNFGQDDLGAALAAAGHRAAEPTTWIWEGVLPYLTQPQVDATLAVVAARSAPGSRLIATYPTPNRLAALGRKAMRVYSRVAGGADPLEHEPHLSAWTPEAMHALLTANGFIVTSDRNLFTLAGELSIPARNSRAYGLGQAVVADAVAR
jgi:methyltransferase (TIGR00027 family)